MNVDLTFEGKFHSYEKITEQKRIINDIAFFAVGITLLDWMRSIYLINAPNIMRFPGENYPLSDITSGSDKSFHLNPEN